MKLEELLTIGEVSPIFKFKELSFSNDICPQLNFIDSGVVCIGLQADWHSKEIEDFLHRPIHLYFVEIDGVLDILYDFASIEGDVAFNPRNRAYQITIESIIETNDFIIVMSLIDKKGITIANRAIKLDENVKESLIESIMRFEEDETLLDIPQFNKRVDELYSKYSIQELIDMTFSIQKGIA